MTKIEPGPPEKPEIVLVNSSWSNDDGLYVPVKIQSVKTSMLVDTGANVTILNTNYIKALEKSNCPEIHKVNKTLVTATGESSPFYGKAVVTIQLGKNILTHEVLIADIKYDAILGMDFLKDHKCDLLLSKNSLLINKEEVKCFTLAQKSEFSCCRISVRDYTVVPPGSEIIVPGIPIDNPCNHTCAIVEPCQNFVKHKGLLVAKSVVDLTNGVVPLRFVNITDTHCVINKNTIAAVCEPIQENEIVYPPEYETVQINSCKISQEVSIPEHLKDLLHQSSQNLTSKQSESLKSLLIEYQNVFSKAGDDLGCTSIVEHAIELENDKPIKQAPRRLPLAKMRAAEDEINKMAAAGVIEKSNSPWLSPVVLVTKPKTG